MLVFTITISMFNQLFAKIFSYKYQYFIVIFMSWLIKLKVVLIVITTSFIQSIVIYSSDYVPIWLICRNFIVLVKFYLTFPREF